MLVSGEEITKLLIKLEFKKHTSNPKMQLRTRGGFLNLKSKLHFSFTNVPHAVH